jgi:hypothetical protein
MTDAQTVVARPPISLDEYRTGPTPDQAYEDPAWRLHFETELAMMGTGPVAALIAGLSDTGNSGLNGRLMIAVEHVDEAARSIRIGGMDGALLMLSAQAVALDSLFGHLARRATATADGAGQQDDLMRLALDAQAQCCRNLEAIATIRERFGNGGGGDGAQG